MKIGNLVMVGLMAFSVAGYADRERGQAGKGYGSHDNGRYERHQRGPDRHHGYHGGHGADDGYRARGHQYGFRPRYHPHTGYHYRYHHGYAHPYRYMPPHRYAPHHFGRYDRNGYGSEYLGGVLAGAAIGLSLSETRP